jgi:hypothetical protein
MLFGDCFFFFWWRLDALVSPTVAVTVSEWEHFIKRLCLFGDFFLLSTADFWIEKGGEV